MRTKRTWWTGTLALACVLAMTIGASPASAQGEPPPGAAVSCGTDEFLGTSLDRTRWTSIVRENAAGMSVAQGQLRLRALTGDLFGDRSTAQNLVMRDVPAGAWTATTKLDSKDFTREGQQAGFVVRKDDSTFSKFVVINKGAQGRWFEHIFTENQVARLAIGTDTTAPLDDTFPRDVFIRVSSDGETIRGEYSGNGTTWVPIGRPARIGADVKLGVYAADNAQDGPEVSFESVSLTGLSDEFNGTALERCRWTQIVREAATGYRVRNGKLEIDAGQGEVQDTATNLIGQPVPAGAWEAESKIDLTTTENGQQAGLLLYKDPNDWIKAVLVDKGDTSQIELVRVKEGQYLLDAPFKVDVPSSLTSFHLRLRSNGTTMSAQYSADGTTWIEVGQARDVADLSTGHVGPMALSGGAGPVTASFDYFRVRPAAQAPAPTCTANGTPETGFARLWNGVDLAGTRQAGPGSFELVNDAGQGCRLVSRGGLGMLWFNTKQYDQFVLRMQWRTADATDNSGVFVRFPDPGTDPQIAINQGHEIQIREGVAGDGEDQKTGSIYNADREDARAGKAPGEWNDYEIRYENGAYTITLNGTVVNRWTRTGAKGATPGYIGIQNHGANDEVSFRNIRIQELAAVAQPNLFTTIGITRSDTRANSQIYGNPTPYSLPAEEMPPSGTVGPAPSDDADNVPLRMPDTSGTKPNLAAFRGQVFTLPTADQKAYSKVHFFGTTTDGGPAGGDFVLRYSDGTTQTARVDFRDWCAGREDTPAHHTAIGPLTQRYRTEGGDGAPCSIYHVPFTVPTGNAGKTLVSVTLPSTTTPASPNIQAYLMALTLEDAGGLFKTPDLSGTVAFPNDQTAPTTTHALNPAAANGTDGWYRGAVRITLNGTDNQGGSGVEQIVYRVNGGAPQTYGGAFDFTLEGAHTLEYRSVDGAGNAEGYKSIALKVDANAPVTTATSMPGAALGGDGWHDGEVKLSLAAADGAGSGTRVTEYRTNGGEWRPYTQTLAFADAGVYAVEYRSADAAGNQEAARTVRVKVDRTAPQTTVRINGEAPRAEYTGAVRVSFMRADGDGSGVASTEYRIGDGAWTAYTEAFDIDGNRGHRIDFRSRDLAGNVENFGSALFIIRPANTGGTGGTDDPGPPNTGTPPTTQPPVVQPPGPSDPPAVAPRPFASMQDIAARRSTVAWLRSGRLPVRVSCQAVDRGTLTLTVSKAVARRLGLKSTTLVKHAVRCGSEGRATVTLKPSAKVKRALSKARGSISAKLTLRLTGSAGAARDTQTVLLRASAR